MSARCEVQSWLSTSRMSVVTSCMPAFMPWPKNGHIACAASPTSTSRSSRWYVPQRMVPRLPTRFLCQSPSQSPMSGTASGNVVVMNALTLSSVSSSSKPWPPHTNGMNSVHVKEPSAFGRAMSMNDPRGQICKKFLGSAHRASPSAPATGGIESSL
eukprot:Amastigsp_a178930_71.p3 type:complete len:157 gc:universal Amastigsp_a178930_71:1105-635(-)